MQPQVCVVVTLNQNQNNGSYLLTLKPRTCKFCKQTIGKKVKTISTQTEILTMYSETATQTTDIDFDGQCNIVSNILRKDVSLFSHDDNFTTLTNNTDHNEMEISEPYEDQHFLDYSDPDSLLNSGNTGALLNDDVFSFLSASGENVSQNVTIPLNENVKIPSRNSEKSISNLPMTLPDVHHNYGLVVPTDMLKVPRRYKCKICRIYFTGRSELDWHKKSHVSNEIQDGFKCFECDFRNPWWESIKEHICIAHADLRPLKCSRCSFATRLKKDLVRHSRTHTSERPHLCSQCGAKFVRACHLKNHLLKKHKNDLNIQEWIFDDEQIT